MRYVDELINYINKSPVASLAIEQARTILMNEGYFELNEYEPFVLEKGGKYFVIRNKTSLIAFNVGENVKRGSAFNIVASHSDSPCFKLKPNCESKNDSYNKINVEPYGGMICSSWLDRPLSVAGRVLVREGYSTYTRLVNIDRDLMMIPNMCIHFNRQINSGYDYNFLVDMQAFIGENLPEDAFMNLLAQELEVEKEDIVNFDLYLYNHEKAILWGLDNEYISGPRLDDLECAFTSLKALTLSSCSETISMCAIFDNEEVGSGTSQGADSDFLETTLTRICCALGWDEQEKACSISKSFLISADNAHAVHPNISMTDPNNKVYMNKGIAIKFNAAQSYTSDGLSSSVLQMLCDRVNVPYQYFTNRSDVRGGSTLGNISTSHLSFKSVDIGLPQLAMHSSYETAGAKDIEYAIKLFKEFFSIAISFNNDGVELF